MKKTLTLSFLILGFSSVVSQVVVIRELAMSFYANEFFIGWVLFCWLFGTAAGSIAGSRPSKDAQGTFRFLALCQVLAAVLFPASIILIRSGKLVLGTPAGTLPELVPSLIYSFAALAPLCGVLGMQFAAAAKAKTLQTPEGEAPQAVGWAYLWECLGFIIGGAVFSFVLVFANEFRTAAVVAVLNFAAACSVLYFLKAKRFFGFCLFSAAVIPAGLFLCSASLQQQTSQMRFPNETLVRTENTVHGNVSVTRLGRQYNFYQSGLLLGADRDDLGSEYLIHFPMLAHPAPKKVLLLGTGFNGPLQQVLKYGPEEVCSVELDPQLLKIVTGFLPQDLQATLRDPRVRVRNRDPLDFLKTGTEKFDVIIANFPDPVSVLVNRNYTEQFFRLAGAHLSPGGVFATHITFAANTMTRELERLGSSVYSTLNRVFPSVKVLPEDTLFFLAAAEKTMSFDPEETAGRLSERGIRPDFVTADQVRYRMTNDRVGQVTAAFQNAVWKTKNTDLRPRACYFAFVRWLSQFDPGASKIFLSLTLIPFPAVLVVSLILLLTCASVAGRGRKLARVSMGTAGFSLMAFEILVIYLFQAAFGDLYYRLAWLITAFMAGLGAGTWAALKSEKVPERSALIALHLVNAAFFFLLIKIFMRIFSEGFRLGGEYQAAFFGAAVFGGLVAGAMFPFANRFYLAKGGGSSLGSVYAADLFGSALGALLTAGFFISIWGIPQTLILLAVLNVAAAFLFSIRKGA